MKFILSFAFILLLRINSHAQVKFDYHIEWTDSCKSMNFWMNKIDVSTYYPYPTESISELKQGLTTIEFSLDETCSISNEMITKSIDSKLDSLSMKILKDFETDLKSRRQDCCPVKSMKLPINYRLK